MIAEVIPDWVLVAPAAVGLLLLVAALAVAAFDSWAYRRRAVDLRHRADMADRETIRGMPVDPEFHSGASVVHGEGI